MNLYVGNLSKEIDDDSLRQLFSTFGSIISCKIMVDKANGESKGFGFVRFEEAPQAIRALNELNGAMISSNSILVKIADRDKDGQPSVHPSDNIFVRHLPPTWSESELNTLFEPFGPVLSSIVIRDLRTKQSKGYGLVRLNTMADAAAAVKALQGQHLSGSDKPLEVKYAEGEEEKHARRTQQRFQQLLPVSTQLPPFSTTQLSHPLLATQAALTAAQLSGQSKLLPFAPSALRQQLQVPQPKNLPPPEDNANLYVYGLDPLVDELFMYRMFAPYGAIVSIKVITDHDNHPKGYGFVRFQQHLDACAALQALNGIQLGERVLQVSFHKPKMNDI